MPDAPAGASAFVGGVLALALLGGACLAVPANVVAQDGTLATQHQVQQIERRLDRVERALDASALTELLQEVESLRRDLRELRGDVESLQHGLERDLDRLNARQRDQFRNLDDRLARLEAGETAPASQPAPEVADFDLPEADEQEAYQEAFDRLMDGDYGQAMTLLERFIENHPDSDYAANAWYWLAEAKYATGDFEAALEDFARLREQFPDSDKSGDALLKMGYSHYELGDLEAARETLEAVRADFGGTTLDRLARERLRRIDAQ
ncbi:MAG: tol-pal system protein YbgF [Pseudomonadota bacterium]